MKNVRRNRLILWGNLVFWASGAGAITYVLVRTEGTLSTRLALMLVPTAVGVVWFVVGAFRLGQEQRSIERDAREAGIEVQDEAPIPIKLAESRDSLIAGIVALVLIVAVFVAYFGGWIGRR